MSENGIISLTIRSAPWEKGSKIGTRRLTLSRLKADTAAMFPVLKNADWRSVRKKREIRASVNVRDRKGNDDSDAGTTAVPLVAGGGGGLEKI
jgi:hypothetical protein